MKAAGEIIPLARSREREIEALRQWATTHCRLAAAETAEPVAETDGIASRRARLVDV